MVPQLNFSSAVESFGRRLGLTLGVGVTHEIRLPQVDSWLSSAGATWQRAQPYMRPAALVGGGLLAASISPVPGVLAMGFGLGLAALGTPRDTADWRTQGTVGLMAGAAIAAASYVLPVVGFGLGVLAADRLLAGALDSGALTRPGVALPQRPGAALMPRLGAFLGLAAPPPPAPNPKERPRPAGAQGSAPAPRPAATATAGAAADGGPRRALLGRVLAVMATIVQVMVGCLRAAAGHLARAVAGSRPSAGEGASAPASAPAKPARGAVARSPAARGATSPAVSTGSLAAPAA